MALVWGPGSATFCCVGLPGGAEVKASACKWETWVRSLGREDPLEKEMATPVFLPGESHEPGGLQGMGRKESDTTEQHH